MMIGNHSQFNKPPLKLKSPNFQIEEILENNNLKKISIPKEGKNNLYKALSFAFFMSLNEENIIISRLISHLKTLIQEKRLPLRLSIFSNDLILFKDYCSNPYFHGFDKVSLELASHCFESRIVVYFLSEENYLNSTIYNNKFEKTISLWKTGTHFDVAVETEKFQMLGMMQNLIYEFLFGVLGIAHPTNKPYFIAHYDSEYDKFENDFTSPPPENKLRPKHKKSRSDNLNFLNEKHEDKNEYYNLFLNLQAPKDFLINITPSNSSRFSKNFKMNPENSNEFVFPNTPPNKPQSNISDYKVFPFEKDQNPPPQLGKPPMFFVGAKPPGLTPKKVVPPFAATEEDFQKFPPTNKNNFQVPEAVKNFSNPNNQLIDNLYKGAPKNKFFSLYSNPFASEQENKNTFNLINEEPTINPIANLSNLPQKPDLNKPNPNFLYSQYIPNISNSVVQEEMKSANIFENSGRNNKKTGRLKFFDESKNYGFIIMDEDGSDIFVHFDDLAKAGVNKDILRTAKQGNIIRLSFNCMNYIGKYNKSKKAVDITLLNSFI